LSIETAKKGPLAGRKVVVTRTAEQAGSFVSMLRAEGAEVIEFPTIETVPPEDYSSLDQAVARLPRFDYTIFTSANALKYFLARLEELGRPSSLLRESRLIAVGPKTAQEMKTCGLEPDIIPAEYKAEGVLSALEGIDIAGKSFLYPRALEARELLPEKLRERGAEVCVAVAYRTVAPRVERGYLKGLFSGGVSAITFTSSSTVKNFMLMAGDDAAELLKGVCVACIGPVTARTCEEMGVGVDVMPGDYTVEALLLSLTGYFARRKDDD